MDGTRTVHMRHAPPDEELYISFKVTVASIGVPKPVTVIMRAGTRARTVAEAERHITRRWTKYPDSKMKIGDMVFDAPSITSLKVRGHVPWWPGDGLGLPGDKTGPGPNVLVSTAGCLVVGVTMVLAFWQLCDIVGWWWTQ